MAGFRNWERPEATLIGRTRYATGAAYVGSISAVDRAIWTAVGETTNRAARLQTLTRELHAAILVDERTFAAARQACADFVPYGRLKLRGMRIQPNVFMKPLEAPLTFESPFPRAQITT